MVDTDDALHAAVLDLLQEPRVALDTETAMYQPPPLNILALAKEDTVYVFDPLALKTSITLLQEVFDQCEVCGHNLHYDARVIAQVGLELKRRVDTLWMSRRLEKKPLDGHGLSACAARHFDIEMDHIDHNSWDQRPLPPRHLHCTRRSTPKSPWLATRSNLLFWPSPHNKAMVPTL